VNAVPARRLVPVAIVVLLLVLLSVYYARSRAGSETLVLYGNVDIREVGLGFRVGGRLASLAVDEGDAVTAGQALGELDREPYARDLEEARGNAQALGARVALLKAGYRNEEIARARAQLVEAEAQAKNSDELYARQLGLKGTGASAARSYDEALAQRDAARSRVEAARQALAELERGYRREEIREGEGNLARAEAAAASAAIRLADTRLAAPADGVILTRAAEPGAILAPGATVFSLALARPVWARVYVSEPDLGRAAPGAAVFLVRDGRKDAYHGHVGYVSPTAEFTPKTVETEALRTSLVYRARIIVDDPDAGLRQGMPVTVRFAP
jgi:HlyD family secretion protein